MKTRFKNTGWFSRVLILSIGFLLTTLSEALSQEKIKLVQNNENGLIVAVNIPSYKNFDLLKTHKSFEQNIINGGDYLIDSLGKPNVPVIISKIAVPNGTKPSIKIIPGKPIVFTDIDLLPVQEPLMDCECEREYRYDSVVYKTDKKYPGILAECKRVKNKRGYKFSDLYMYPYQYNPVQKKLFIYPDMSVTIEFNGSHQAIRKSLKNQRIENFIKYHTVNGGKVLQNASFYDINDVNYEQVAGEFSQTNLKSTTLSSTGGCEYLIITHDDFESAANTLQTWKESIGI